MLDIKYNIKGLVSSIYECQKRIILNRRFMRELEIESQSTTHLEEENKLLEEKIREYQRELKKKYMFSYWWVFEEQVRAEAVLFQPLLFYAQSI